MTHLPYEPPGSDATQIANSSILDRVKTLLAAIASMPSSVALGLMLLHMLSVDEMGHCSLRELVREDSPIVFAGYLATVFAILVVTNACFWSERISVKRGGICICILGYICAWLLLRA